MAHAFIDAVAGAGAHAIKFQTHIAVAESTPEEPWRVRFSQQDATRYEYWKRMEFTAEQWAGLKEHADERGLLFLSSPFSIEAVQLLNKVGVAAWKVASGEISNSPLLEIMAESRLPFILSSGMSSWAEIDKAVELVRAKQLPLVLLQCTSRYPTPPEKLGLNVMASMRERYGCSVGFSDHSGTIFAGLAAATLGAKIVEVHVTFSREMFGPDVPVSLTMPELRTLVDGIHFIEQALKCPIDKDVEARELATMRELFTKSVVLRKKLAAGTILSVDDLTAKKPGTGIPVEQLATVVGKKLRHDKDNLSPLRWQDLE
ncbi:MAG: N-acetylneuraminate synthase family protein [Burkholderiaceae bacterium]